MSFLLVIIVLVIVFDFINGFHDAANSIATVVATRVLSPFNAVIFAGFFNFVAYFLFEAKVAATVGKGIVEPSVINLTVIGSGLIGAIFWNLLTWWQGIPSSSSHALMGGLVGAALIGAGFDSVQWNNVIKIFSFIFVAPIIGFIIAWIISGIVILMVRKSHPQKIDRWFRGLQLFSAASFSIGHGGNDAQKSMGIIYAAMIVSGEISKTDPMPEWAALACYSAMSLGTMLGGWKIVKTMGEKITKLKPFEGVCAETAGAFTLFGVSNWGIPVSTTHTITGSIFGVGARNRPSAVKWGVARSILKAWILTIPASAAVSALTFLLFRSLGV
jgi:PiT family inorganic phosphate transporter